MIRKAELKDLKEMAEIYKAVFPSNDAFAKSLVNIEHYLIQILEDSSQLFLVSVEKGVIGGIVVKKKYDSWKLKHLGVRKDMQGKGVGRSLILAAEKEIGTGTIEMQVAEDGPVEFYKKLGYEVKEIIKGDMCPVKLEKKVSPS